MKEGEKKKIAVAKEKCKDCKEVVWRTFTAYAIYSQTLTIGFVRSSFRLSGTLSKLVSYRTKQGNVQIVNKKKAGKKVK